MVTNLVKLLGNHEQPIVYKRLIHEEIKLSAPAAWTRARTSSNGISLLGANNAVPR